MPRVSHTVLRASTSAALVMGAVGVTAVPAAAKGPSSAGLVSVAHHRVLSAKVTARTALSFGVPGVPAAGVSAIVLTVSVAASTASGTVVVYPFGAKRPGTVSVAFTAGHAASATVVVGPGSRDRLTVYNSAGVGVRVAAAVTGYYAVAGTPAAARASSVFLPVNGKRIGSVALRSRGSSAFVTLGKAGVPVAHVGGVAAAVTVAVPARSGTLVVSPYGNAKARSTITFTAGRSVTSFVVVEPGSRGRIVVTSTSAGAVRVSVDVVGYLLTLRAPTPPQSVQATGLSTAARVSWRPPVDDGGTSVTAYTVVAEPGGATVVVGPTATSAAVSGLTNGTPYALTVTAVNSRGRGTAAAEVTPFTVPGSPGAPTATSGAAGQAAVSWAAPTDTGGAAVTEYQVTASPGGVTATIRTPTVTMNLAGGTYYSFTVVALNPAGASTPSVASNLALVQGIARVSSSAGGDPGNDDSHAAAVSQHGRFVAFQSRATNLAGQPSAKQQVYRRDRQTGVTSLISVATNSNPGNGDSTAPSISADGRYVVFSSNASDLVAGDGNDFSDVFVRDTQLGATRLLSSINGVPANQYSAQGVISADGTTVAFTSYATDLASVATGGHANIYVAPLNTGVATLVSETATHGAPTHDSGEPAVSGDGAVVAFESSDPALQTAVPLGLNQSEQVYVRAAGVTTLLSSAAGSPGDFNSENPNVSADGTYVAFQTTAANLVASGNLSSEILIGDTATHVLTLAAGGTLDTSGEHASISSDGAEVAYDSTPPLMRTITPVNPGRLQVFRARWQQGSTVLVSSSGAVAGNGDSTYPALSGDGLHVAFQSLSSNLTTGPTNPSTQVLDADLG